MRSIFFLLLFITSAYGETYKIAGKYYEFKNKNLLSLNKDCSDTCIAYKRSKSIKPFKRKKDPTALFDMSLGSYICKNIIMGKSVMGLYKNKDMKAFCYFKEDQSMVELNSLEAYYVNQSKKR